MRCYVPAASYVLTVDGQFYTIPGLDENPVIPAPTASSSDGVPVLSAPLSLSGLTKGLVYVMHVYSVDQAGFRR